MSNGAHGVVVLGFFAIISTPIVAGMIATNDLQDRAVREYHERSFASSCDTYRDMTTWERWSTPHGWDFGWCEEYLHRM